MNYLLVVNQVSSRVYYVLDKGIEAWSGYANECLRSLFSGEVLTSTCLELRDVPLHPPPWNGSSNTSPRHKTLRKK